MKKLILLSGIVYIFSYGTCNKHCSCDTLTETLDTISHSTATRLAYNYYKYLDPKNNIRMFELNPCLLRKLMNKKAEAIFAMGAYDTIKSSKTTVMLKLIQGKDTIYYDTNKLDTKIDTIIHKISCPPPFDSTCPNW